MIIPDDTWDDVADEVADNLGCSISDVITIDASLEMILFILGLEVESKYECSERALLDLGFHLNTNIFTVTS